MTLDLNSILARMRADMHVVTALCADVDDAQARWRPAPDTWSLLEVIGHLHDEEREDFRVRLDLTLHSPDVTWPAIRPNEWVTERDYNAREIRHELNRWLAEREASMAWLRGLQDPDWGTAHVAPWGEKIRAGDLLAAWLAHDFLHIRQLTELQHAWQSQRAAPYVCTYAGDW